MSKDRLAEVRRRHALAEAGGGEERRERQHKEGKLSARERIDADLAALAPELLLGPVRAQATRHFARAEAEARAAALTSLDSPEHLSLRIALGELLERPPLNDHAERDDERLGDGGVLDLVGIGADHVMRHHAFELIEPPRADLGQHCALHRDGLGHHDVECADAVGREQQHAVAACVVDIANLAAPDAEQGQVAGEHRGHGLQLSTKRGLAGGERRTERLIA